MASTMPYPKAASAVLARTLLLLHGHVLRWDELPLTEQGNFPNRVHVFEDFETEIEKRWSHRGVEEKKELPASLGGIPNTRAWRSGPSGDFDDKQGDQNARYNAVVFNPVPGPPMGR